MRWYIGVDFMSKYKTFVDGSDISDHCVKCGSEAVVHRTIAQLQYAPFWATYLALNGGFLKHFYKASYRSAQLRLGFCSKHKGASDIVRDIGVVLSIVIGCGLIGLGMHLQYVGLQLLGCVAFIIFFFFIKAGNPVKVKDIKNGYVTIKTKIEKTA